MQRGLRFVANLIAVEIEVDVVNVGVPGLGKRVLQQTHTSRRGAAAERDLDDLQSVAVCSGILARSGADPQPPFQRERITFIIEKEALGFVAVKIATAGNVNGRQFS